MGRSPDDSAPRNLAPGAGLHGAYLPEDVVWEAVGGNRGGGGNHHRVYLMLLKPGYVKRTKIFIGEVRRASLEGSGARRWRAFPELSGDLEFPEVCENHFQALLFLKKRWEARTLTRLRPERDRSHISRQEREAAKPLTQPSMSWTEFFGGDPFA